VRKLRLISCLSALLAASCATDSAEKKDPATPAAAPKTMSERLSESNGYKQDADGNWVPQNDKRSSFESQGQSAYFQGDYGKKTYKAGDFSKKSWWGGKNYGSQQYAGNTDASRFQTDSSLAGKNAGESGSAAKLPSTYQTGQYATSNARETGRDKLAKPSDAETDARRKVYQAPEVIDWREQRSLSLEQSKGILGR
jgi:hypothetical protein